MSCPCCAHIRLISAISADLCYTHFPALFSFCFVIIFPARIGALYSIQRSGNDRSKLRSVKACRSYEHREAAMQECSAGSRKTFAVKHPRGQYWFRYYYQLVENILL